MKKLLMVLLLPILVLPLVVKADMEMMTTYYNDDVKIGDEVVIHIPVREDTDYEFKFSYDVNKLKIDESKITISSETTYKIINDQPTQVANPLEIDFNDGNFSVKTRMDHAEGVIDDFPFQEITLRFTAIGEGEATVSISSPLSWVSIGSPSIKISAKEGTGEQTKPAEPAEPKDPPKGDKNKDLAFYGSILVNVLQLIAIITLVVVGKKKVKQNKNQK